MEIYLEKVRLEKNLSISELARISGVSKSHIHNIENGLRHPTIPAMCKLAIALNVPCSALFSCGDGVPGRGYN